MKMPDRLARHCSVVDSDGETLDLRLGANSPRDLPNEFKEC